MNSPELIWDGKSDSGSRSEALAAVLGSIPAGVSVSADKTFVEITTRSMWAIVTWAVSAVMLGFGLISNNWFLLVLAPFMVCGAMMQSLGRVSVLIGDAQISVFEGVGGVGKRRRIALRGVQSIEYAVKHGRGGSTAWIVIHGAGTEVKFGRHLNQEQIYFVMAVLMDAARKDMST